MKTNTSRFSMMTTTAAFSFGAIAVIGLMATPVRAQVEITRSSITCGGGTAASDAYKINGSLGIDAATVSASTTYVIIGGIHFGAAPTGGPCTTASNCKDDFPNNACNHATCPAGSCVYTCVIYGDVKPPPDGDVTLDDILCVLGGFGDFSTCINGDIFPCGGNGIINLDDILYELAAFGGANPCGCDSGGVAPLCGSSEP